jgi:Helix-turn-helix domain
LRYKIKYNKHHGLNLYFRRKEGLIPVNSLAGYRPSTSNSNLDLGKLTIYYIMPKVNRYRIYPTKSQVSKLNDTLELCRWVYNETLELRKKAQELEQKRISYFDSKKMIPIWKKDKPAAIPVLTENTCN